MTATNILLLAALLLCGTAHSQKIFSLEYKYTQTKYMGSRNNQLMQPSYSYQIIAGAAKEVKAGFRLGFKLGATADKIYSNLSPRAFYEYSRYNVLAYLGINVQKRLLADPHQWVSLWACADIAAEPFLSHKSVFMLSIPTDSLPENDIIFYNAAYIDKRMRIGVTPMLRLEVRLPRHFSLFAQAGYAIEFGKSNLTNQYRTSLASQLYLPNSAPKDIRAKENYLFVGGGIGYTL